MLLDNACCGVFLLQLWLYVYTHGPSLREHTRGLCPGSRKSVELSVHNDTVELG